MRDATTGKTSKRRKPGTDWEALNRLSAADIRAGIDSDPDTRATDENFWKDAQVVFPKPKRPVTLRLDADLLEWFRRESGYQTRINAILRAYMDAQKPKDADHAKP
ncbi:MAG: BrnA antitoxin family protein [Candidatus Competibacter sp.]|nr:BrnA antitoxin family protein [Candidatus Competibacter sp.]